MYVCLCSVIFDNKTEFKKQNKTNKKEYALTAECMYLCWLGVCVWIIYVRVNRLTQGLAPLKQGYFVYPPNLPSHCMTDRLSVIVCMCVCVCAPLCVLRVNPAVAWAANRDYRSCLMEVAVNCIYLKRGDHLPAPWLSISVYRKCFLYLLLPNGCQNLNNPPTPPPHLLVI